MCYRSDALSGSRILSKYGFDRCKTHDGKGEDDEVKVKAEEKDVEKKEVLPEDKKVESEAEEKVEKEEKEEKKAAPKKAAAKK